MTIDDSSIDARMLSLVVGRKVQIAEDIFLFELVDPNDAPLPAFDAGSHVVVVTPCGATRRYAIANAPYETNHYLIAIKRDAAGGGGSISMADGTKVGTTLSVSYPMNQFPLAIDPKRVLLIAGGIGIAPIHSMAHSLATDGIDFDLVYCTRSPETTAFREELASAPFANRVRFHHDHGDPACAFPFAPLFTPWLAEPGIGTHLYCCGPRELMQAVREHSLHWPAGTVHFEDFGLRESPRTGQPRVDGAFKVVLARTGVTIDVAADDSIMNALRRNNVFVPSSCETGTCGACRTGLIAGSADHRDFVLDDDDRNSAIMICVSRATSGVLELDL